MNREIKFRAWLDGTAEMAYSWHYDSTENQLASFFLDINPLGKRDSLMQYTGLKDRNGKEIYEGDVVRYKIKRLFWGISEEEIEMEVTIIDGLCNASPHYIELEEESCAEDVGVTVEYIEVIGNIYENPELIKP